MNRRRPFWPTLGALLVLGLPAPAEERPAGDAPISIHRLTSPITVDGELSDPGWREAARITAWYEFRPGDGVEPPVASVAYLAYDEEFLYAAFDLQDPAPWQIRAPLGDRDDLPDYTDHAGVILDAAASGVAAQMFFANPRGIQYDAILSDAAGEDPAPDFYWDSAGRITPTGWTLEIRIPFSSLRYSRRQDASWGILLYRNYPRDRQYEMASSRLPRDSSCRVCRARSLEGLEGLPDGGHWVLAPYASASQVARPAGELGTPLAGGDPEAETGFDLKWLPSPDTAVDLTVNPDFSQVESDVAQITANERFALFVPERRPFFLEGADLFSTQIPVVHTRTITRPRWGARATGELAGNTYTLLVAEDDGGGSVILPGSLGSELAPQDFSSLVAIGRWRRPVGRSLLSFLYSGREIEGGGFNRVFGPDWRWQPTGGDTVSGQLLLSASETPERPDLAPEWDGRTLSGHAVDLWWERRRPRWDHFLLVTDLDEGFRADNGFVPQVGLRRGYAEGGTSFYPEGERISRLRLFAFAHHAVDRGGRLLLQELTPGFELEGRWSSDLRVEAAFDQVRGQERTFRRRQLRTYLTLRPGRVVSELSLALITGDEVDFAGDRLGAGRLLRLAADLRPGDHLRLDLLAERRSLEVKGGEGRAGRLFTAEVARLRATYTFTARCWLRLIGQWARTERDPGLYPFEVDDQEGGGSASALFAYKLNWQTVLFAGWAENRLLDQADRLARADRQLFLKLSYSFQR